MDRAALDVALELGVPCGGWCPRGRRAEDGRLPARYPMRETPSAGYWQRTAWNVRDSDGTLVLARGPVTGGTAYTVKVARQLGRPVRIVRVGARPRVADTRAWMRRHEIHVLNVAGSRERLRPGIAIHAAAFLRRLLAAPASSAVPRRSPR